MAHTADNYTCHTRHVQRGNASEVTHVTCSEATQVRQRGNASEATQVPWPEPTQVDRRNYPPGVDFFHTGVRRRKYKFAQTKHSGYRGPFSFDRVYASSSSLQCERNPPQGGNSYDQSAFAYVLCLCPLPMSFAYVLCARPSTLAQAHQKHRQYTGVFRESTEDEDRPSRRCISAIAPVWHHTQRFRRRHGRRAGGIRLMKA
jgi:hypothetical protein